MTKATNRYETSLKFPMNKFMVDTLWSDRYEPYIP